MARGDGVDINVDIDFEFGPFVFPRGPTTPRRPIPSRPIPFKPPTPESKPPVIRTPPIPVPAPAPFPGPIGTGDPTKIPKLGSIIFRGLGRLAGPVGAVLIIKDIIDLDREAKRQQREADEKAKRDRELQRQADAQIRTVTVEDFPTPEPQPQPEPLVLPPIPQLPEITTPTEIDVVVPDRRVAVPQEAPNVEIFPEISIPSPTPTRRPATTPATTPRPAKAPTLPTVLPFLFPSLSPSVRPSTRPGTRPASRNVPQVAQPNLTRFQQPSVGLSPSAATSPQLRTGSPVQNAQSQCQEVKRRRRRRGKCREGFFREFPGGTQYVTWRERDCAEQPFREAGRVADRIIERF